MLLASILLWFGIFLVKFINVLALSLTHRSQNRLRLKLFESSFPQTNDNDLVNDKSLWKDKVEYFDLNSQTTVGYDDNADNNRRSLPLFLLGGAFYPQGRNHNRINLIKVLLL